MNARAFTVGNDIFWDSAQVGRSGSEARKLLAHELTHVIQHNLIPAGQATDVPAAEAEARENAGILDGKLPIAVHTPVPFQPMKEEAEPAPEINAGETEAVGEKLQEEKQTAAMGADIFEFGGFARNSTELSPQHLALVRQIVDTLILHPLTPGSFIVIKGFNDLPEGAGLDNPQLGLERANALRDALLKWIADPAARQQIKVSAEGSGLLALRPKGTPEFQKVTISIVRKDAGTLNGTKLPDAGRARQNMGGKVPNPFSIRPSLDLIARDRTLPPWFLKKMTLPAGPVINLGTLSRILTDGLRQPAAESIAPLAVRLASAFGKDLGEPQIRASLEEAFVKGGEAGLKMLLRKMIFALAGAPLRRPLSPYGQPGFDILPSPTMFGLPPIKF